LNPFKQVIWKDFWDKNKEKKPEVLIDLLVKEALEKLPHHNLKLTDRYKIKRVDLDLSLGGTLVQLNTCTSIVDIGPIVNLTCFVSLVKMEYISIMYFNPHASLDDPGELVLESSLRQTNLFKNFQDLKKVKLIELCADGSREVNVERKDIDPY